MATQSHVSPGLNSQRRTRLVRRVGGRTQSLLLGARTQASGSAGELQERWQKLWTEIWSERYSTSTKRHLSRRQSFAPLVNRSEPLRFSRFTATMATPLPCSHNKQCVVMCVGDSILNNLWKHQCAPAHWLNATKKGSGQPTEYFVNAVKNIKKVSIPPGCTILLSTGHNDDRSMSLALESSVSKLIEMLKQRGAVNVVVLNLAVKPGADAQHVHEAAEKNRSLARAVNIFPEFAELFDVHMLSRSSLAPVFDDTKHFAHTGNVVLTQKLQCFVEENVTRATVGSLMTDSRG